MEPEERTVINTYHRIDIYLKQPERSTVPWLQWQRGKVRYGVSVTNYQEALSKAWAMIDAMLELEAIGRLNS